MKNLIYIIIAIFIFSSCEKDDKKDPEIETLRVSIINGGTIKAEGKIIEKGDFEIIDYGFVYTTNPYFNDYNQKISLGKELKNDTFSALLSSTGSFNSQNLYVRAFLQNSKGYVYGKPIEYIKNSSSINSIQPTYGVPGDTVVIIGSNFSEKDSISVYFNSTNASVIKHDATHIYTIVPENVIIDRWDNYVHVAVNLNQQQGPQLNFNILPIITSFSPTHGSFGTTITIKGKGFIYDNILIGDISASTELTSTTTLKFVVPYNMKSIKSNIVLVRNNHEIMVPGEFTMDSMKITSLSPNKVVKDSYFNIIGENFNPQYENNKIKIGGVNATFNYDYNSNVISAMVPGSLDLGVYDVEISNGLYTTQLPNSMEIVAPHVIAVSPDSGNYGELITFTGENLYFNGTPTQVYFGSDYASVEYLESTKIMARIPWTQNEGEVYVKLIVGANEIILDNKFTIIPPKIKSFYPVSGSAGTIIKIEGKGFLADNWNTSVKFGSVNAKILSFSSTSIEVQVPSEAPEGKMKISLTFFSKTINSTDDFTVIK